MNITHSTITIRLATAVLGGDPAAMMELQRNSLSLFDPTENTDIKIRYALVDLMYRDSLEVRNIATGDEAPAYDYFMRETDEVR